MVWEWEHELYCQVCLHIFTAIWQALPEHDGKNWETLEELLPSDHQAPNLKLSLITLTRLNLINCKIFSILHHPYCSYVYIPGTTGLHFPLADPCFHCILYCTFYFIAHLTLYYFLPIFIFMFILLCCVAYFALSIERTWPDLHFTTD